MESFSKTINELQSAAAAEIQVRVAKLQEELAKELRTRAGNLRIDQPMNADVFVAELDALLNAEHSVVDTGDLARLNFFTLPQLQAWLQGEGLPTEGWLLNEALAKACELTATLIKKKKVKIFFE